jgi:hypothetical protein
VSRARRGGHERGSACGGLRPRRREWGSERMGTGDTDEGARVGGARVRGGGAATCPRWTPSRAASGSVAPAVGPRRAVARGRVTRGHRGHPSGNADNEQRRRLGTRALGRSGLWEQGLKIRL